MGHRLSKIYTRTGDKGDTGLSDGTRVKKTDRRIEALGCVDELNSCIGTVASHPLNDKLKKIILEIQHDLFDLGGELSMPGAEVLQANHTDYLESTLDQLNADLPYLKEFILPSGNASTSFCHLARSICRRTERICLHLNDETPINSFSLIYLNRLSDLLFVMARVIARADNGTEVTWQQDRRY